MIGSQAMAVHFIGLCLYVSDRPNIHQVKDRLFVALLLARLHLNMYKRWLAALQATHSSRALSAMVGSLSRCRTSSVNRPSGPRFASAKQRMNPIANQPKLWLSDC